MALKERTSEWAREERERKFECSWVDIPTDDRCILKVIIFSISHVVRLSALASQSMHLCSRLVLDCTLRTACLLVQYLNYLKVLLCMQKLPK